MHSSPLASYHQLNNSVQCNLERTGVQDAMLIRSQKSGINNYKTRTKPREAVKRKGEGRIGEPRFNLPREELQATDWSRTCSITSVPIKSRTEVFQTYPISFSDS